MYALTVFSVVIAFAFSETNTDCAKAIRCTSYLQTFKVTDIARVSSLLQDEVYDVLCSLNNDFQSCFVDAKDSCNDLTFLNITIATAKFNDYLCSEEGKKSIKSIDASVCAKDKRNIDALEESLQQCEDKFQESEIALNSTISANKDDQPDNTCTPFVELRDCVHSSLNVHCDDGFVSVTKTLFDLGLKAYTETFDCLLQV